jgi:hypothetical protein
VPTLVLAPERDFWAHPADREKIAHDLVHASVRVVAHPNATHFMHRDKPEHGQECTAEGSSHISRKPASRHYFFGCDSDFPCAGICPCSLVGGTIPLILM